MAKTLYDKLWEDDVVHQEADGAALLYSDRRLVQEPIAIDNAFIGSCTDSRIAGLRAAALVLKGRHVAASVKPGLAVPRSGLLKRQAEADGLDKVLVAAGFEWREPGGSMCLAMNADRLKPGERCTSTSNRNFEGRQGPGGRTHLVSTAMAAAAEIAGRFADVRDILQAMATVRWWLIGLLAVASAGCNTAQGVKKDVAIGVEKTGEALQKSGEAVGNALNKTGDAVGGALKKSGEAVQKKVE